MMQTRNIIQTAWAIVSTKGTGQMKDDLKALFGGVMWPNEQDFSPETIEHELFIGHRHIGKEANNAM